ncbi:unnamed protein product [Phytophthora fragariaefolia]|uniref:Unnamed protein product n=1 Tax=Phytophthora fragariaefolia TaxID=1490495 RepID=A0A9W6X7D2_9STRA|nr:unnamed protein product [Phytophthora fragariaefolia]
MALEYPLYAHLAPGQWFFDNMTKTAILAQIHGGPEAAPAHRYKIEAFKQELSRISIDMKSRVLKVTFKGKMTAAKWAGWQLPLASKLISLIDYDMIRERARRTHELVMLDYYSFEVGVRKGVMSSREMFALLADGLGLAIQEMMPQTGVHERQWQVRVRASECPKCIEGKSYVMLGEVEVIFHHAGTHVNWPCRTCASPEHPTRFCTMTTQDAENEKKKFMCAVETTAPRGFARAGTTGCRHSKLMEYPEELLRKEGSGRS